VTTSALPAQAAILDENGQISQPWRQFMRGLDGDQSQIGDYVQSLRTDLDGGWMLCDGSEVSQTTYATLYKLMAGQATPGNGPNTFLLPKIDPVYDPAHPAPNGPPLLQTWVKAL
jgi:hypothetical protein